ncbi:MAG: hypothetical protein AAF938_26255 [Myxococcota bacterium]
MSDTPLRAAGASPSSLRFVEPGSLESRADALAHRLQLAASAARHGRLEEGSAAAIMDAGERVLMTLDPQNPSSQRLRSALREFDQSRGAAATANVVERSRPQGPDRPTLRQAIIRFQRGRGTEPLLRALGGSRRNLRPLAEVSRGGLYRQLRDAGASDRDAHGMLDQLKHTATIRFGMQARSRAVSELRRQARAARRQSHADLSAVAPALTSGKRLHELAAFGIDTAPLQAAIGSGEHVEGELRLVLRELADRMDQGAREVAEMNPLSAQLFREVPGMGRAVAERSGMLGQVADGRGDGSLLGDAVAEHVRRATEERESANTWASVALIVGVAIAAAPVGVGMAVSGGIAAARESSEVRDARRAAEVQGAASAAGLGEAADASLARFRADRRVVRGVENVASAIFASGAAAPVAHAAAAPVASAAGRMLSEDAASAVLHGAGEYAFEALAHWSQGEDL